MSELNGRELANTAWAFATVKRPDAGLFTASARVTERRVSEFNAKELANTAWAFATVKQSGKKLLTALGMAAERRVEVCNMQDFANTTWAFATVKQSDEKLFTAVAIAAELWADEINSQHIKAQSGNKVFNLNKKLGQSDKDLLKMLDQYQVLSVDGHYYLCSTCKSGLLSGTMPSMAVGNGLELSTDPQRPELTDLENNLISHTINFQKIVFFRKSRWLQGQGKMISVPVKAHDIMNSVKSLPRLPSGPRPVS